MSKRFVVILNFIIILLLSSCSTVAPVSKPINPKKSHNWLMEGKIAVRYPIKSQAKSKTQSQTANIDWRQENKNYCIRIFGPLGLGAVRFQGDKNHIELIDNQGNTHTAPTAEILSQQILGYPLPIENLIYWLKGIKTRNNYGWEVKYLAYGPNGLPKLIEAHQKEIYIRIFIERWRFF